MSAATPLALSDALTSHLDFLRSGVRFYRETAPSLTSDGARCTLDVLKVKGPPDPQLMAALREAVEWRVGLLSGGLAQARARTWREWQAQGKPVAVRSGITHGGPDKGKPWSVSGLPAGTCECCGSAMGAIVGVGGNLTLRADVGEGMCSICELSWSRVLADRS